MKRKPLISTLEPRLLFDGAAVVTAIDVLDNNSFDDSSKETIDTPTTEKVESEKREIVFIDSDIKNYETLAKSFDSNIEVFVINDKSSGIDQIASFLENKSNIDSIHIFSHGKIGEINIGNDSLNSSNINNYKDILKSIGNSLTQNGDILLYGCSVSQNDEGKDFVDSLSELTSADISASDDITGNKSLGADWELEYKSGSIEATTLSLNNYDGTLANAAPVITPTDVTGAIAEGGTLSDSGSIAFTDADAANRPTATETLKSITALKQNGDPVYGFTSTQEAIIESGFSITNEVGNTNNGTITWNYELTESQLNFLGENEVITAIFTITVNDQAGGTTTQDVTITITGKNDTIVVTPGVIDGTITEGTNTSVSGSIDFADAEPASSATAPGVSTSFVEIKSKTDKNGVELILTSTQTSDITDFSLFTKTAVGSFTNAGTYNWTYSISADKLDFLGVGDTIVLVFAFNFNDYASEGNTASQNVEITLKGSNDAVLVSPVNVSGDIVESATLSDNGSVSFSDADSTDRPIGTVSNIRTITAVKSDLTTPLVLTAQQELDIFSAFSVTNQAGNSNTGVVNWNYLISENKLDFLGKDEVITAVFSIIVTDASGNAVSENVTITLKGETEAPTIIVADMNADAKGSITEGSGDLSEDGTITFSDLDADNLPIGTKSLKTITALGQDGSTALTLTAGQLAAIEAGFSITNQAGNTNTGTITWNYTISESNLDFLAAGEVVTATFTITVDDQVGGVATQDIIITITGGNDTVSTSVVDVDGNIVEGGTLIDTGSLTFSDIDLTDRPSASVSSSSVTALQSDGITALTLTSSQITDIKNAFTMSATGTNTGTINWNYTITESNLNFLVTGEVVTATFTISVIDSNGSTSTQDVTVKITGTNDAPAIQVVDVTGAIAEGGTLSDNGSITFTDIETKDRPIASSTLSSVSGLRQDGSTALVLSSAQEAIIKSGFSLTNLGSNTNNGTVNWDYSLSEVQLDFLGEGEVLTATFTITVDDQTGGTATQDVTITLTGKNDSLSTSVVDVSGNIVESDTLSDNGSIIFNDIDSTDRPTSSITNSTFSALEADGTTAFTLTAQQELDIKNAFSLTNVGTNTGSVNWDYTILESNLDFLGKNEVITATFTITTSDGKGSTSTQDVVVIINGANEVPIITAVDVNANLTEGGTLSDTGSVTFTDLDLTDRASGSGTFKTISGLQKDGVTALNLTDEQKTAISLGFSVLNAGTNTNDGTVNWAYLVSDTNLDFLAEGEVLTAIFTITVDDKEGGTSTQDVTVTITGTNDSPVVSSANIDEKLSFSESYTQDISGLFSDIDKTDTYKYEITGLPTGLTYDANTGIITGKALESGLFTIEIKAFNTKNSVDIVNKNYKLEVIPPNTDDTVVPEDIPVDIIIDEPISNVEVNDFVTDDVQGVLDISLKDGSEINIGKGFVAIEAKPDSNIIDLPGVYTTNQSASLSISDNGKIESIDTLNNTNADSIGLSIEVMSRTDSFIEMKITDVELGQRYEVFLLDGSPLPKGITFDEKTGLLKGKVLDNLEVTVKAISKDGTIRTLNIKIEAGNNKETSLVSDSSFIGLQEQIDNKASNMQEYGKHISSLFSNELV